jgi:hypothetical protein
MPDHVTSTGAGRQAYIRVQPVTESLILRGNRPLYEEFCPNLPAKDIINKDGDATNKDLISKVLLKSKYDF